jgi:hypothetical protein
MKVLPIIFVLVPLIFASCVSTPAPSSPLLVPKEFFVPAADEPLYGIWVNPGHRPPLFYPKAVIHPWGLVELFRSLDSTTYDWRGTSIIVQKWPDAEGNIWYKEFSRCSLKGFYSGHAFYLDKLSPDGNTLETIFGNIGWPTPADMDPNTNTTYAKYRRLE